MPIPAFLLPLNGVLAVVECVEKEIIEPTTTFRRRRAGE